jgi:hypothetical protein
MRCSHCDFENRAGVQYCEECGQLMIAAESQSCAGCGYANRVGLSFCEECGQALIEESLETVPAANLLSSLETEIVTGTKDSLQSPDRICAGCGASNRDDVHFCEECGQSLAAEPAVMIAAGAETLSCPACGLTNRSGISFCEECGQSLTVELEVTIAAAGTVSCPACGLANRSGISFCEECGQALGPAVEVPAIPQVEAVPERRKEARGRWMSIPRGVRLALGAAALAAVAAGAFFWLRPDQAQPVNDFGPVVEQIEDYAIDTAASYLDDWAPWVDPGSAELTQLEQAEGVSYVLTYDQSREETGEFNPQLIIVIDPYTGDELFIETP